MSSVNLIVELEAMYNIEFEDEELLTDNFSTIRNILERTQGKMV